MEIYLVCLLPPSVEKSPIKTKIVTTTAVGSQRNGNVAQLVFCVHVNSPPRKRISCSCHKKNNNKVSAVQAVSRTRNILNLQSGPLETTAYVQTLALIRNGLKFGTGFRFGIGLRFLGSVCQRFKFIFVYTVNVSERFNESRKKINEQAPPNK